MILKRLKIKTWIGDPTNCYIICDEDTKETMVVVDNENLSLAIGKKGINVKLASRLTHYNLEIKTYAQVKEAGINILE